MKDRLPPTIVQVERAALKFAKLLQQSERADNLKAESLQIGFWNVEQVVVAGYEKFCSACMCRIEKFIVVRVTAQVETFARIDQRDSLCGQKITLKAGEFSAPLYFLREAR